MPALRKPRKSLSSGYAAETGRLFPIVYDVPRMLEGHRRLLALAGSMDHFVPGHDPLVLQRCPRLAGDDGIVELHRAPLR